MWTIDLIHQAKASLVVQSMLFTLTMQLGQQVAGHECTKLNLHINLYI